MLEYRLTQECSCSYLPNKSCIENFKIIKECTALYCQQLMERGWRRFGETFFRPICYDCHKCESLRIVADEFVTSRSMRRIMRKNSDTQYKIERPHVSDEKLKLYNDFHLFRAGNRGWNYNPINEDSYRDMFVTGQGDFAYEVQYVSDGKLVGVDMIDILPGGISSVYFYYDPTFAHLSLGVYSLLMQIELARTNSIPFVYLGYAVRENASLNYKFKYSPYDILEGRPMLEEKCVWNRSENVVIDDKKSEEEESNS